MYESYWHLEKRPFENRSDPSFYYAGEAHQGALLKLRYTIENRRGGGVISGAAGLGKSLLVSTLFRQLPEHYAPRVHIVIPQMPPKDLLAYLADEVDGAGAGNSADSSDHSIRRIQHALAENTRAGKHAVVAVDESHILRDMGTLETMRLLMNIEVDSQPALTLLLVGQPPLLANLDRMPCLDERLDVKCILRPFTQEETTSYISHRLTTAGASFMVFDESALAAIHALSLGVPRRINRLSDLALLIGFADETSTISAHHIESVSHELASVAPE
jgi:general secretion pathway protein A